LLKLEQPRLAPLFNRVGTPREKDVASYRHLIDEWRPEPECTFMIGNSPRSDINPAVRAGLRAVDIPHPPAMFCVSQHPARIAHAHANR